MENPINTTALVKIFTKQCSFENTKKMKTKEITTASLENRSQHKKSTKTVNLRGP